jgi:hypothetical protein
MNRQNQSINNDRISHTMTVETDMTAAVKWGGEGEISVGVGEERLIDLSDETNGMDELEDVVERRGSGGAAKPSSPQRSLSGMSG